MHLILDFLVVARTETVQVIEQYQDQMSVTIVQKEVTEETVQLRVCMCECLDILYTYYWMHLWL